MKILRNIKPEDIIFIDVESARGQDKIEEGTDLWQSWAYKMRNTPLAETFDTKEQSLVDLYNDKSPLYPEFLRIITISIGAIRDGKLQLKSFYGADEKQLLSEFVTTIDKLVAINPRTMFCGFNIFNYDLPVIQKRLLINNFVIPDYLDTFGLKEWNIKNIIDLAQMWKSTSWGMSSLINVAVSLGIPSPKEAIDGSMTSDLFYADINNLEAIKNYCEVDVLTTANIYRRCIGMDLLEPVHKNLKVEKVPILTKAYNTKSLSQKEKDILTEAVGELSKPEQKIAKDIFASINLSS